MKRLDPDLYKANRTLIQSTFDPTSKKPGSYKLSVVAEIDDKQKYLVASNLNWDRQKILEEEEIKFFASSTYFAQEPENEDLFLKGQKPNGRRGAIGLKKEELANIPKWSIWAKANKEGEPPRFYLSVFSLDPTVLEIIDKVLPYVLIQENFGTRQSKGFGCFSLASDAKPLEFETKAKQLPGIAAVYRKRMGGKQGDATESSIEEIRHDYHRLKSGINLPKPRNPEYWKSLLFYYACSLESPIRWEKRHIKKSIRKTVLDPSKPMFDVHLDGNRPPTRCDDLNEWKDAGEYNYSYLRVMLGLAEQLEFKTKNRDWDYVVGISSQQDGIDRFRSPLTFKVVGPNIYILVDQDSLDHFISSVGSTQFLFTLSKKPKKGRAIGSERINPLPIPNSFSLVKFLDHAINKASNAPRKHKLENLYTKL